MKVLQRKLSVRIFLAVCSFFGTILSLGYGFYFIYDGFVPVVLIFTTGFAIAFLVAGLNVLMAKIEYDDEKLVTRSFRKARTIYYKDITYFGRRVGSSTGKSRVYYWIMKTNEGTVQIDVPVNSQSLEFGDFVKTMKKGNEEIKVGVYIL